MVPSFLAFFTKAGMACASDHDATIYQLSKKEPLAMAVNPKSPIPWEDIIKKYKLQGEPAPQVLFSDYASAFEKFLSNIPVEESWKHITPEESNIVFFGYGMDDIYPSAYDVMVEVDEEGKLCFTSVSSEQISINTPFTYNTLGNLESVSTILNGATKKTRTYFTNKFTEVFKIYKQRIAEKVKGTEYEDVVIQHLNAYHEELSIEKALTEADAYAFNDLTIGIVTFSVQELIDAVETLIAANAKLNHLKSGGKEAPAEVKEIAIMTRPEGMTWIKHSLFAL